MDWVALIKIVVPIITVVTAMPAIKKLKMLVAEYREITEPRAAQPHLQLGFRWVGELALNMVHPPEIVFQIGNRENRILYLSKIEWYSPSYRLRWDAKAPEAPGQTLQPGQGLAFKFDPVDTLVPIIDTDFWATHVSQIRLICGLRLSVRLQSGEELSIAAPRAMKLYLAYMHRLPILARSYIRLRSFVSP